MIQNSLKALTTSGISVNLTFTGGGTVKKLMYGVILGLVVCGLAACSSLPQWQATPPVLKASNKWVDITVTPILEKRYTIEVGYTGMLLELHNKTGQDLTVNWDETVYLQGGTPNGGFLLQGTSGARLRGYDVIFPHETFVATIYPSTLAQPPGSGTLTDPSLDYLHKPMPAGENGIDIKMRVGFEDARQRLTFMISG
jgi:hypothetical protein